ncbi:hypothetical protein H7F33_06460 [Pedobacter sp. PAMC26386]|nr:hypothetical protein H7F33_06460 [Pedobacter sp. PAMC26386]
MKISRNDPFDLNKCVRGLGVLVTYMHSDLYEYIYYLTFKKAMKSYAKEFKNAWEQYLGEEGFFQKIEDPFVQNCLGAELKLMKFKLELALRFGIDEEDDFEDGTILLQATRFEPYRMVFKQSKNYKNLKLHYEKALTGFIECLYLYACALTAKSYKIPLVLKRQFKLPAPENLKLLNEDENTVELLIELINGLQDDLDQLRLLLIRKTPARKPRIIKSII